MNDTLLIDLRCLHKHSDSMLAVTLAKRAADEIEALRAYAVQQREAVRPLCSKVDELLTAIEAAQEDVGHRPIADILAELGPLWIAADAALAKNPKPSGDGHGSVTTTGAPAPEGAGYAHETCTNAEEAEVRLDSDGKLDEVVSSGAVMENLDFNHWFIEIGDVAVWLHARGRINATYERRPHQVATLRHQSGKMDPDTERAVDIIKRAAAKLEGESHQVNREPSMTTLEIRSWLAPATGECRQQIERLLAHLGELEGQQPREPEPCEHAWFTDPGELHLAVGEKMVVPMPHCSKCGISKAEHVFGPSRDTSQFVACTKQDGA